jgi:hypothetical protein
MMNGDVDFEVRFLDPLYTCGGKKSHTKKACHEKPGLAQTARITGASAQTAIKEKPG